MIRQTTVWPGIICSCKGKDVKQMCSTDFVLVIETELNVNNFQDIFEGFIIKQYLLNRENKETKEFAIKGIIPIFESHFPSVVCKYQTDILEGRPSFAGQLRIGEVIGTLDNANQPKSRGTLGGFVKHIGHECLMTCAHVVIDLKNLLSRLDVDTENNGITVYNFPPTNPPSIIGKCGKVMRRIFEHSQHDNTSIDVALVGVT
ncbi:unnamed protein product [Mytilus coruscus]|uniref:Uncharacterized protein n=1 Tax=Mytilus coruscus TaxID=42192 RepID=A0A6J8EF49_MYTCO|nr:unnamed protein product [Mytilus coruscus]